MASLFMSQHLIQLMRDRGFREAPYKTQKTEAQPLNFDNKAWAAPALEVFNLRLELPLMPERASAYSQCKLSSLIDAEASHCLISSTTEERDVARLKCIAREKAGDWLGVLPSKALGLHL